MEAHSLHTKATAEEEVAGEVEESLGLPGEPAARAGCTTRAFRASHAAATDWRTRCR